MTKSELKQWFREYCNGKINLKTVFEKVDQLDEPEPETIPFTWPIPPGYEPVTRDGRKVEQLVRFEVEFIHPIVGVIAGNDSPLFWGEDGHNVHVDKDPISNNESLFLRKIAPEMVTLYINCYITGRFGACESQQEALDAARYVGCNYAAVPITFPKPKI